MSAVPLAALTAPSQAAARAAPAQRCLSRRTLLRRWRFDAPAAYAANAHDGVEIAWCDAGRLEYVVGTRVVAIGPGAAVVIPADVEHVTRVAEPGTSASSIHVARDVVAAAAEAAGETLGDARAVGGSAERPSTLATLGALLVRETAGDGPASALLVDALTDAAVVAALRAEGAPAGDGRGDHRVRRAIDLIHARYADPLTLEDLARAAHVSRFHFARLFRVETGKSPYQYLLDLRLERAAELLRTRRCPVTEAAMSVGCTDLGRFGRMFRQAFGVRPSEYLRASTPAAETTGPARLRPAPP